MFWILIQFSLSQLVLIVSETDLASLNFPLTALEQGSRQKEDTEIKPLKHQQSPVKISTHSCWRVGVCVCHSHLPLLLMKIFKDFCSGKSTLVKYHFSRSVTSLFWIYLSYCRVSFPLLLILFPGYVSVLSTLQHGTWECTTSLLRAPNVETEFRYHKGQSLQEALLHRIQVKTC